MEHNFKFYQAVSGVIVCVIFLPYLLNVE